VDKSDISESYIKAQRINYLKLVEYRIVITID